MMMKLRESTAIIMWIVIIAFVGLIVVEWGADYSGTQTVRSTDAIGVINGHSIPLKSFQEAVRAAAQRSTEDRQERDDGALVRQVWDQLVGEILVRQELERVGIEISDEELAYYTSAAPPPAVQSLESFQVDGEFDINLYNQFLRDPSTYDNPSNAGFVMWIERTLENQLLNFRLRQLFMETVRVSPGEVRHQFVGDSQKATIEYVFSPASAIPQADISYDETELQAHYEELAVNYPHDEQVRIAYAIFPRAASAADSASVEEDIKQLRREVLAGSDFAELARIMSEDAATADSGGDLGTFGRGRMVKEFEDVAFSLEPGEISQPILTQFGWHLIKVEAVSESEEGDEERQASHVLLKIRASPNTEDAVFEQAQELRDLAAEMGLDAAAAVKGAQIRSPGFISKAAGAVVPGLGQGTAWVVNLFLDSEVGALSQVGSVKSAYFVAELLERRPQGVAPLAEVRTSVERSLLARKRAEAAAEILEQVRGQVESGADLATAAAEAGSNLRTTEPFARSDFVPDIGRKNAFVGTAFRLQQGQTSDIITDTKGAYLLRLLDLTEVDEEAFEQERTNIEQQLLQQKQGEALQAFLVKMYDTAQIEDNRHLFYTF